MFLAFKVENGTTKGLWPCQSVLDFWLSDNCVVLRLMLKLKLQYFGHLMWRVDSLEKTLMLGGIGGRRRRGRQRWDGWMASPTQWTWVWVNSRSWWWTGRPGVLRFMGSQRVRCDWATELNWSQFVTRGIANTDFGTESGVLLLQAHKYIEATLKLDFG